MRLFFKLFLNILFICACIFAFLFGFVSYKVNSVYASTDDNKITQAKGMVVIESSSLRILNSFNERERLPMASTTKIITAICTIENVDNLDNVVEIPRGAQGVEGSSIYLTAGEHLTYKEILYGLMLESGNDCATALAILISGSEPKFVELMNEFCKKIGAYDTHIVTTHGLHNDDHYTTAYDLAIISAYAMKNKIFADIVSTKQISIAQEFKDYPRLLKNKNKLLNTMDTCTGIKIGYTPEACRCLVASAKREDMEIICVVLNCQPMFDECEKLLNKAFDEYHLKEILPSYYHVGIIPAKNGTNMDRVNLFVKDNFYYPVTTTEENLIRFNLEIPSILVAPVLSNQIIGDFNIYLGNNLIFSQKVFTMDSVSSITFESVLKNLIEKW